MKAHLHRRQSGQIIVLAAVVMAAMLGMVAFVVDAGIFLETRRELQNGADAGALAGVAMLPPGVALPVTEVCADVGGASIAAHQVACDFTEANLAAIAARLCRQAPHIVVTTDTKTLLSGGFVYTLTVTTSCEGDAAPGYTFGRVLGLTSMPIRASATAAVGSLEEDDCAFPLGIANDLNPDAPDDNGFVYDGATLIALKVDVDNGNTFAIRFPDHKGGNDFRKSIAGDCATFDDAGLEVGQTIESEPGKMVGPTTQGLEDRGLKKCTGPSQPWYCSSAAQGAGHPKYSLACPQTLEDVTFINDDGEAEVLPDFVDSPCLIALPIVDWTEAKGKSDLVVEGFALFFLSGYVGVGGGKTDDSSTIYGYFVRSASVGQMGLFNPDGIPIRRLIR